MWHYATFVCVTEHTYYTYPMKIIVCGSMTASREMMEAKNVLESLGHEVVLPEFTEAYARLDSETDMHRESSENKMQYDLIRGYFTTISDGDSILVVNIERKGIAGYIGGNTFLEMGFAHVLNKPIYVLNELPDMRYLDEMRAMQPIIIHEDYTRVA